MKVKLSRIDQRRQKTINVLILNIIKYFLIVVAIIIILSMLGVNMNAVVASLGVVGVVVGLAFQDILKDFLSGISIIVEDQYKIGDIMIFKIISYLFLIVFSLIYTTNNYSNILAIIGGNIIVLGIYGLILYHYEFSLKNKKKVNFFINFLLHLLFLLYYH